MPDEEPEVAGGAEEGVAERDVAVAHGAGDIARDECAGDKPEAPVEYGEGCCGDADEEDGLRAVAREGCEFVDDARYWRGGCEGVPGDEDEAHLHSEAEEAGVPDAGGVGRAVDIGLRGGGPEADGVVQGCGGEQRGEGEGEECEQDREDEGVRRGGAEEGGDAVAESGEHGERLPGRIG